MGFNLVFLSATVRFLIYAEPDFLAVDFFALNLKGLFIQKDEIGEMPLEMQATLLRVLQENLIVRIGGKETIPIDVRIIAATNKNLSEEIKMGSFRKDLYYRLNVFTISIPPLRERPEDINILAEHFLDKLNQRLNKNVKRIGSDVLEIFNNYRWPGNVRELQNVLERAVNVTKGEVILPNCLPEFIYNSKEISNNSNGSGVIPLKKYEKQLILTLLDENKGNRAKVAKAIGISRTTLYRKLVEYNIKT
ncbi:MAG: AAA-type ATPase lid domain-containing protein [Eubacteriales bacterium]